MTKETKITTGKQLINFIESEKLNSEQICEILEKATFVFADKDKDRKALIQDFKEYWERYESIKERPMFLND